MDIWVQVSSPVEMGVEPDLTRAGQIILVDQTQSHSLIISGRSFRPGPLHHSPPSTGWLRSALHSLLATLRGIDDGDFKVLLESLERDVPSNKKKQGEIHIC
jgi:hypothetical protein